MANSASFGTPDYTMGFSEELLESLRRHTAQANAAYLLPHLAPGTRILDFGCGPGTISAGLAWAVAPGEMHGVDMEESQIALATSVAAAGGHDNATFHVADVTALPFQDNFFDVAHCHNVLMHVPDTDAVLAEVMRVLKPGGILGCREMICASCFTHPDFGVLRKAWDTFEDLIAADDGHPQMGKELMVRLIEAGFDDVSASLSFDVYSTSQDIEFIDRMVARWFLSPEIMQAAIKYGAATPKLYDDLQAAYVRWKEAPGAVLGIAFGEALGSKP